MHRLVVRLGSLHVGERAHGPVESLLQPELGERDLARRFVDLQIGERPMGDPVRLDANAPALELHELVPVDRPVENALRGKVLLVRQRQRVAEIAERDEQDAGIAVLLEHACGVLEIVVVAVVERDQHGLRRQRLPVDVVREHGVEIDDFVAELPHLVHLLVEQRHRHRQRVAGEVVDLVVHQHAQAAVAVAVRADRCGRLADRAVDRVLQPLLDPLRAHRWLA